MLDEDSNDTPDETLRMVPGVGMTDVDARRAVEIEAVKGGPTWLWWAPFGWRCDEEDTGMDDMEEALVSVAPSRREIRG